MPGIAQATTASTQKARSFIKLLKVTASVLQLAQNGESASARRNAALFNWGLCLAKIEKTGTCRLLGYGYTAQEHHAKRWQREVKRLFK